MAEGTVVGFIMVGFIILLFGATIIDQFFKWRKVKRCSHDRALHIINCQRCGKELERKLDFEDEGERAEG